MRTAVDLVLECAFPMIMWWGEDETQFYNDAYRVILGNKHPAALGRPGREAWAEIWAQIAPLIASVRAAGTATYHEDLQLFVNRSGFAEETFFTFSYSPVRDDRGAVGGVLGTVAETTKKVQNERRLRSVGELAARSFAAESVAEAAQSGVDALLADDADIPAAWVFDADGTLLCGGGPSLERAAERIIAEAAVRVLRERAATTVELPAGAPFTRVRVQALGSAEDDASEVLASALSTIVPHDADYHAFLDVVGRQFGNALKNARIDQGRRERTRRLAEIDQAKTDFFNNVSHEFRTPLTLMLGTLDELAAGGEVVSGAGREQLAAGRRNALRLLKLVNTLLEFSRIEAGRLDGFYRPTDLAAVTADLASTFRSAIESSGVRFTVDARPLPQPVYCDRGMWERVLLNLLSNALKFTFEGEIGVRVEAAPGGESAVVTVSDTGVGIPPAELPHLFERFRRVRGARSRSHEGSGIGLALANDLVALHGGSIAVQSEPGRGTAFIVTLPFGRAHLGAEQIEEDAPAPLRADAVIEQYVAEARGWHHVPVAAAPVPRGVARVLVADDNADLRAYVARLLDGRYAVEAVADGQAALDAVRRERPSLLITDAMMPRVDGFELIRRLRADPATAALPIVMLSARAGGPSAVEGLDAGADDYLAKPFAADELVARIDALLKFARQHETSGAAARDAHARRFLSEALDVLSATLDRETTIANVLRAGLPVLGDGSAMRLVDDRGRMTFAGVDILDPERRLLTQRYFRETERLDFFVAEQRERVLRDGIGLLVNVVSDAMIAEGARDDAELALRMHIAPRSLMILPLTARGRTFGTLSFAVVDGERRFDQRDLTIAEEYARRAAMALDNALLYDRERRVAHRFQEAALPTSLPSVRGFSLSSFYAPGKSEALVGGDWYDALRLPDGRLVVSIGDVAGSGLDAAVTMGHVRQVIRGVAHIHPDPALILDAADKTLRAEYPDRLVTAFIAVLDPVDGSIAYASAGHPPPLLRRTDGTVAELDVVGLPLGLRERDEPRAVRLDLARGALLLLYTDGLVEATHDYLEGDRRVRDALSDCAHIGDAATARAIYDRVLPDGSGDDVAILAVQIDALGQSAARRDAPLRRWGFDARDGDAAQRARHEFVRELVASGASEDDAATAELVFGELVGNVVRHTVGGAEVVLDWSGYVPVLHVLDEGAGFEHNAKLPSDLLAESGRGLFLIAALTVDFSVSRRLGRGSHARTVLAVRSSRRLAGLDEAV